MRRIDRRSVLKMGAAAGAGLALAYGPRPGSAQSQRLSVLGLTAPDPAPPSPTTYANDLLDPWKTEHDTAIDYRLEIFPEIDRSTQVAFDSGEHPYDVLYNWAMVPVFAPHLTEIGSRLPADLVADLPASQGASVSWGGRQYGVVFTTSPLLFFFNRDYFASIGVSDPPATWDDLKRVAQAASGNAPTSLMMPYGATAGIGGVCSVWSAFLQQAGGRMYDETGQPVFDDASGVDALQLLIDLMPYTSPDSLQTVGYADTAFRMSLGMTAMTFSFPPFWRTLSGGATLQDSAIQPAVMPAGPENNATISGVDAWTIAQSAPNQELAMELVEFFLRADVQKQQALQLGWLPARLSMLADPDVQAANPLAAVALEQVASPFDNFVTLNFMEITNLIGMEIRKALTGQQTAAQALAAAKSAIQPLVT